MKNTMKKPVNIPVSKLRPFDGHPFEVKDDDEMSTLIESVQTQGVLSPLIVRPIFSKRKSILRASCKNVLFAVSR